jgi:hypothetical protein
MEQMVSVDNRMVSSSYDGSKKAKLVVIVIIFGVVILAIILYILNYFRIINIANLSSQKAAKKITHHYIIGSDVKENNLAKVKAEKAGYKVVFITLKHKEDSTGRYILASKERIVNGWTDNLGWQEKDNISMATGMFWNFIEIKNSKDKYITLLDPKNNIKILLRVIYEANVYKEVEDGTVLNVSNLDFGPLNNKIIPIDKMDFFNKLSDNQLNKIIKLGDVITVLVPMLNNEVIADKDGNPVAQEIGVRRFGGISQINMELK